MVRTKKVSKGSRSSTRSSTRKKSTISRCSTVSTAASVCDSDGFAVPAPAAPTLESLNKDLKNQFNTLMHEFRLRCKTQMALIDRLFVRQKIKHKDYLHKPIVELFKNYQPPPTTTKNLSAKQTTLMNSKVMQDRTNTQYSSKTVTAKASAPAATDVLKQPAKTRNSLRLQQQQQHQTASAYKFVTPVSSRPMMPAVTPKVNINSPLSILRRPKAGEFAMSIEGSPLMVSHIPRDEIPSVCVPLPDGTILSILPNSGMTVDQLPYLDPDLKAQLQTLQSNLKFITGNR